MSQISRPKSFVSKEIIKSAELNAQFDTVYTAYNMLDNDFKTVIKDKIKVGCSIATIENDGMLSPSQQRYLGSNLLQNSTFAFGLDKWGQQSGISVALNNEPTMADTPMVRLGGVIGANAIYQQVRIPGNQQFTLSWLNFSNQISTGRITIGYIKSDGTTLCTGTNYFNCWIQTTWGSTFAWNWYNSITPPDCAFIYVQLTADETTITNFSYFKNIKLEKLPYPTLWSCDSDLAYFNTSNSFNPTLLSGASGQLTVTKMGNVISVKMGGLSCNGGIIAKLPSGYYSTTNQYSAPISIVGKTTCANITIFIDGSIYIGNSSPYTIGDKIDSTFCYLLI